MDDSVTDKCPADYLDVVLGDNESSDDDDICLYDSEDFYSNDGQPGSSLQTLSPNGASQIPENDRQQTKPEVASKGKVRKKDIRITEDWLRGKPLEEKYCTNNDIPEDLKELLAKCDRGSTRPSRSVREKVKKLEEGENEDFDLDKEAFEWLSVKKWQGSKEPFLKPFTGPTTKFTNAYEAFRAIWDDGILNYIVEQTNLHANTVESQYFHERWQDTNIHEIIILFVFWIMLGVHNMPTVEACFSKNPLLKTDVFRFLLQKERYMYLNRSFRLAEGMKDFNDPNNLLYPMGPVLSHLNKQFQIHYSLSQDISIEESLTLWKGLTNFRQYIKTKAAQYAINTYEVCELATGYIWSFVIYTSRQFSTGTVAPIVRLLRPLLNLGHVLHVEHLSNIALARFLKRSKTDVVGMIQVSDRNVPELIKQAPLAEGQYVARQCGDILLVSWQDKRRLNLISTCHGLQQVLTPEQSKKQLSYKLKLYTDYKSCTSMSNIDRKDENLEQYLIERNKSVRWTTKLFRRLLSVSIQNARILVEQSEGRKIDSLAFRLELAQALIDNHHSLLPVPLHKAIPRPRSTSQFPLTRLTDRHFVHRIPVPEDMLKKGKYGGMGRKSCIWCSQLGRKDVRTSYECEECKLPMCLEPCFKLFHTVSNVELHAPDTVTSKPTKIKVKHG